MNLVHWWTVSLLVCYLKEVKTDACNYVVEIGDLYCKDASLGVLSSNDYPLNTTDVSKLRRINLVSANLTIVEGDAFEAMVSLVYLEMNGNKLQELDNGLFNSTPELRQLSVAYNQIQSLNGILFDSIPKLTHLDISGNPLSTFADPQVFMSLKNLLYLTANSIKLKEIPTDVFEPLTSLRELKLYDNDIECKCNLRNISYWAKEKCFSMSVNCKGKLGTKSNSFETYYENRCGPNRRLKTRRVTKFGFDPRFSPRYYPGYNPNNRPRPYPTRRYQWDDPPIDYYDIYNPVRRRFPFGQVEEDYIYDDTDNNETISFQNITVKCPKNQCNFSRTLDRMDCESNEITNFQSKNYPFKERGFTELMLDNNKLENLDANAFEELSELTTISLRKNGLRTLDPDVFKNLKNLIYLDLSDNLLGGLFEIKLFASQKNLRILYVNNNGMGSIDRDVLKHLTSLRRVFMSGNPFDCNCQLKPTVTRLLKRNVLHQGTCRYPVLYDGKSWDILQTATYCRLPLSNYGYTGRTSQTDSTTLTLMFFGIILLIVGVIQLIHYMVNRYYKPKPGGTYYIPPDFDLF